MSGQPYSPFRSLGWTLFGGRHDLGECWIAVIKAYKAYYDASGSQTDPAEDPKSLVVVGLIATDKKWLAFEDEWSRLLDEAGIQSFRASDYVHGRGRYGEWDTYYRERFMSAALGVLKAHVNKSIGVGVLLGAYARLDREYLLSETYGAGHSRSGAYAFAAGWCHARIEEWMGSKKPNRPIGHVFEHGDVGQGALLEQLNLREVRGGHSFQPKQDPATGSQVRQFEAADLMAWQFRNGNREIFGEDDRTPGPLLATIAHHLPIEPYCFDEAGLRKSCRLLHEKNLLPRREEAR